MEYKGIAFFDVDGVLADCKHRLRFNDEKDYDSFYSDENILLDSRIDAGINLLENFNSLGYKIVLITNRRESCREATMEWLRRYFYIYVDSEDLYLRPDDDHRKSWEVKRDLVNKAIDHNKETFEYGMNYFVDDYPANCKMVEESFKGIKPIIFGCGRLNEEKKGE